MSEFASQVWYNGVLAPFASVCPSIASPSLHLGIGVFDGLMAYCEPGGYSIPALPEHLSRFKRSCERIGLLHRWDAAGIGVGIKDLLRGLPAADYYVRPLAFQSGPRIYLTPSTTTEADVVIMAMPVRVGQVRELACQISSIIRVSRRAVPIECKVSGGYVNSYLARLEAERAGYHDALFLDGRGVITEASAANVFFVVDDRLVTPSLQGDVFPGLTRNALIGLAQARGIVVEERDVLPSELMGFSGGFLCATLMEVQPIVHMGSTEWRTPEDGIYQVLAADYRRYARAAVNLAAGPGTNQQEAMGSTG
ncbi:MAG: aminotransferase class IV family protein [Planctomycetes bacterium]|nr:aminotransferase class IV family protein [Planctomycetota bacterium]